ncbi:MAG TPA: Fur family transcriptional regulator [Syntrophorhabdaceae bacterium]|nr:Fur family transcriptional regulator [Syntrophorhabdaceae bacterium]
MMTKESIIRQLKERGLRLTSQRLAVIDVLVRKGHLHPSAPFIYRGAKKKGAHLSLSSVYANIKELSRHGIIKSLEFDGKENRIEGNLDEHINLICEQCGRIVDYEAPVTLDQRSIAKKTGFMITRNRLEYYGYCGECAKSKAGAIDNGGKRHSRSL